MYKENKKTRWFCRQLPFKQLASVKYQKKIYIYSMKETAGYKLLVWIYYTNYWLKTKGDYRNLYQIEARAFLSFLN